MDDENNFSRMMDSIEEFLKDSLNSRLEISNSNKNISTGILRNFFVDGQIVNIDFKSNTKKGFSRFNLYLPFTIKFSDTVMSLDYTIDTYCYGDEYHSALLKMVSGKDRYKVLKGLMLDSVVYVKKSLKF